MLTAHQDFRLGNLCQRRVGLTRCRQAFGMAEVMSNQAQRRVPAMDKARSIVSMAAVS